MPAPMGSVTMRMPAELLEAVDAAAAERRATRSALIRGVLEDAFDSGELPTVPPTPQEQLDDELERLRELSLSRSAESVAESPLRPDFAGSGPHQRGRCDRNRDCCETGERGMSVHESTADASQRGLPVAAAPRWRKCDVHASAAPGS
jgi:hypothetical protein